MIFSLLKGPVFNFIGIFLISFILAFQFVWSIKLGLSFEKKDFRYVFLLAIISSEIALLLSLTPISAVAFGIVISAFYYYSAGYVYLVLEKKLFPETLREFNFVFILIIIFLLLAVRYS